MQKETNARGWKTVLIQTRTFRGVQEELNPIFRPSPHPPHRRISPRLSAGRNPFWPRLHQHCLRKFTSQQKMLSFPSHHLFPFPSPLVVILLRFDGNKGFGLNFPLSIISMKFLLNQKFCFVHKDKKDAAI